MSINKVLILGTVGRVDSKEVAGSKVASFSVATSEQYKNRDGEYVESITWHNVQVWGKSAEFVEANVTKGSQVFVEGKIQKRKYTDKNGVEREAVEVRAESVQLLNKKQERQDATPKSEPIAKTMQEADKYTDDSDLPF